MISLLQLQCRNGSPFTYPKITLKINDPNMFLDSDPPLLLLAEFATTPVDFERNIESMLMPQDLTLGGPLRACPYILPQDQTLEGPLRTCPCILLQNQTHEFSLTKETSSRESRERA